MACGSGHILNECFDLLYDLYISEGYTRREAIECIFTKNLTGIDIDTRAKQLATFALMLKACQRDSSLVDVSLMPHVYDMSGMPEESRELGSIQIFDEPDSDNPVIAALSTHYDAIVMNPPYMGGGSMSALLSSYVKEHYPKSKADMMTVFMEVAMRLTKHDGIWSMINLPSWMFINSFEQLWEEFLSTQHILSLLHLGRGIFGSDFGSVAFVVQNSKAAYIGIYRRLFKEHVQVRSVDKIRDLFLNNSYGYYKADQRNFSKIPGSPIGYWVSNKMLATFDTFDKIVDKTICAAGVSSGDNNKYLKLWFEVSNRDISRGCDSDEDFHKSGLKYAFCNKGGAFRKWYGNNEYVALWCNSEEFHRNGATYKHLLFKEGITWSAITSSKFSARYYPKGYIFDHAAPSMFIKNADLIHSYIGFLNSLSAREILGLINPTINMGADSLRKLPINEGDFGPISPLVSTCISISKEDWDAHETSWDFEKNPLLAVDVQTYMDNIDVKIEKHRQKTGETLCIDPEAPHLDSLKWRYEQYCQKWESLFLRLHANEEELNRRFIEIYGLQDELTPDVPLNEVTILQQGEVKITDQYELSDGDGALIVDGDGAYLTVTGDTYLDWQEDVVMKQFISYAVGCMMGRYRIDRPGLAIAHPNETPEEVAEYDIPNTKHQTPNTQPEKFWIDDDGIIPLMPEDCGFHDNAVNRFATFVRQTLGDQTQVENLNFIEECLGKSLEQYFIKDFWKGHKKMYQNRPIYWLFASKKGAFQVLVYVHRMNVATVERIRSRYLLPYIESLNKRIDDLQANESTLSTKQRNQLKALRSQVAECEEYHNRLAVVAERGIVPNLDDGIIKNHAIYGDIVTKLK